jgi:uncharacterized repeat protein (TIGR02543 family)
MSKKKLAGIIVGCIVAIIVIIVIAAPEPTSKYTLSANASPSGAGSVSPSGGEYESGAQVTLTATPASGYTFDYWSGSASGTSSTITITMDSDKGLTAHFEQLPKLTLADATAILNLSSELPGGFTSSYDSKPTESNLLGTGSGSQFHSKGTVFVTKEWCQIQLILWIVDDEIARSTSVEEVLAEYHLTGDHIDVGNEAEAIKNGDYGSGFEFLVIKYQNAYVVMNSWYSHPQDEYVDMIELAKVIAQRLTEYSY